MTYTCEICAHACKTKQQYERHMTSKKHLLRTENNKLFQCPDCKKSFSHLSTLSHHKKYCSQKQNPNNEPETDSTEVQSLRKENRE